MSTAEKYVMGLIGIATITTLILPGRQTPAVINAAARFVRGTMSTAMTGRA